MEGPLPDQLTLTANICRHPMLHHSNASNAELLIMLHIPTHIQYIMQLAIVV